MFGLKRKKLSEVQLQKAEAYGEKVGTFLSRDNPVRKANIYAARHRLWVLPAIVMATFTFTLVGLFLQPLDYEISNYDTLMINSSRDTVDLRSAFGDLDAEVQLRADSIESLLRKDHLSPEDSLYISSSYVYIETIGNLLYNHEEVKP